MICTHINNKWFINQHIDNQKICQKAVYFFLKKRADFERSIATFGIDTCRDVRGVGRVSHTCNIKLPSQV